MLNKELIINMKLIDFIEKQAEKIRERLELNPIKIEIKEYYGNCACIYQQNRILFGLSHIKKFKNNKFEPEFVPIDSFSNRVYFIIAHEIAHSLQHIKFPKWCLEYSKNYKQQNINNEDYINQKLEKNASKIASILLKEYKKENKC